MADDQSSPQKSGKSNGTTQSVQVTPGGMMGGGMKGGGMMRNGMMGGSMVERGMKMMQMHQKMQDEMKALDVENDKLVAEMNQATGQKKIDAMATMLTRLVVQRKMMDEKMGAMHADMMQIMMEGMGAGTVHEPAATDKNGSVHDQSTSGDNSQHQH
jgi:hypothetical protein